MNRISNSVSFNIIRITFPKTIDTKSLALFTLFIGINLMEMDENMHTITRMTGANKWANM